MSPTDIEVDSEIEALTVQTALRDKGIDCSVVSLQTRGFPGMTSASGKWGMVRVAEGDAEAACKAIAEWREAEAPDLEAAYQASLANPAPPDGPPARRPPSPFVAGVLSAFVPGLGQVYCGLPARGLVMFVLSMGGWLAHRLALGVLIGRELRVLGLVVGFASLVDAVLRARALGNVTGDSTTPTT